jgi:hypothetical protein
LNQICYEVGGAAIVIIKASVILTFLIFNFNVASYLATGSETIIPTENAVEYAFVKYSPSLSGATKDSALHYIYLRIYL